MTRLALTLATLAFGGAVLLRADPPRRPNIVFLFSDDHAYQAVSAYGHPLKLNRTPNIDRLAAGGTRFDR